MVAQPQFQAMLSTFWLLHQQFGPLLDVGLLLFARWLGFITQSPLFSRKDLPMPLKVGLAMLLSLACIGLPPLQASAHVLQGLSLAQFLMHLVLNVLLGLLLGFCNKMVFETVTSAGALANNQIGLSAANIMDPTTQQQNALLGPFFGLIGTLMFLSLGGLPWLVKGFVGSLTLMPLHALSHNWFTHLRFEDVVHHSSNLLTIGLMLASPFFVVTIVMDLMLGIVNKTAQQIPVFQISANVKPLVGIIVLYFTLPSLMEMLRYVFSHYLFSLH
jgi:flagellar biosynthetic protein FliR